MTCNCDDDGGIGGLLAVEETAATNSPAYWFLCDGNGNVMQLLDASTLDVAAVYECDAYGDTLVAEDWDFSGIVDDNPFRFSTKYFDPETGLYYYGYRYYSPRLGRWLSRDPIGESADILLYGYIQNGPIDEVDPVGRWPILPGPRPPVPPGYPRDPQRWPEPDRDAGAVEFEIEGCTTGASVSIVLGARVSRTGYLRLDYMKAAAALEGSALSEAEKKTAREVLRAKYREIQTEFGKAWQEAFKHKASGRKRDAAKTNEWFNRKGRQFVKAGKCMVVVGIAVDVYAIVEAPPEERAKVAVMTVGGAAGAWAGTKLGALCGTSCGGPIGGAVGALAGAIAGACGGELISGVIYDEVAQPPAPPPNPAPPPAPFPPYPE
jgi:RHS repeat-associated protein